MFKAYLGLKESGGISINPWLLQPTLSKGQHAKFGVCLQNSMGLALTITAYTTKMRITKQDSTVLVLTGTPIDNAKGELEFVLSAANSDLLAAASNINVELELALTASPEVVSFYKITSAFNLAAQAIPVP